jgi:cysteine desulfurase
MSQALYFDYMSTTPLDPEVLSDMLPYMQDMNWCANPSSLHHAMGQAVLTKIEEHRAQIASLFGAKAHELIFTSGATEANNIAIMGAARFYKRQGRHLITLATEHKAVLNVFEALEKEGFSVTYLKPQMDGLLDLEDLKQAIRADTILVSVMQVNNEIGVIQDIQRITKLVKSHGILMHVDAAQSVGRVNIDLKTLAVDLMTFSAHKAYGPKGIGALFVRQKPRVHLLPIMFGGSQEHGLRPGTLDTPLIIGMSSAFQKAHALMLEERARHLAFRLELESTLKSIPGVHFNGSLKERIAENLNVSISGVDGSELITSLYPLMVSSQSACSSSLDSVSHVLKAIGVSEALSRASIRISFGRFTQASDIHKACDIFKKVIPQLQNMV